MKSIIKKIIPLKILKILQRYHYEMNREKQFYNYHGYQLKLNPPKTFNEKIYYRKYNGNFHEMAMIADKYRVRDYVSEKIGKEYLIPLLGVYDKFTLDDWERLPDKFVLKTNHGSGIDHVHIIRNKREENPEAIIKKFNAALKDNYGIVGHQPFYAKIKRKIIAEEYLESGKLTPDDYKIHCFKNKLFIQVDRGRYENHQRSLFNEDWLEMDYKLNSSYSRIKECIRPDNLDTMLKLAKQLAGEFDYIRVDFYNIRGRIFFGELTQTHGNGTEDFKPTDVDSEWGKYWEVEYENKFLYNSKVK